MIYLILFLIAVIVVLLCIIFLRKDWEGFEDDKVPNVTFPFRNIFNEKSEKLNIILLTAPFREKKHMDLYEKYKKMGMNFMGISSYSEFPGKITNPHDSRYHEKEGHLYEDMASTWLHCFRRPSEYVKKNMPMMMMSESDFKDFESLKPDGTEKKYDFIYCCLDDNDECKPGWQSHIRNWELAKKLITYMCSKGLKGCLVGRKGCKISKVCDGRLEVFGLLNHDKFLEKMRQSKMILVPNTVDASPRVAAEAMCLDMPVLMNYNITGGWKYINDKTGEFFYDEDSFKIALDKILNGHYEPRKWFMENYGKKRSSEKLAKFINTHYQNVEPKNPKLVSIAV